jgi:hypothetical protein
MGFSDAPWAARFVSMGDEAESQFEARYGKGFERAGLKRPKIRVRDLHPFEAQRPDYLTSRGYVEVMGMGRDQTLKLKVDKLEALRFWRLLGRVHLWVWDSHHKRHVELPLERLEALTRTAKVRQFPEGTPYYALPADGLFGAAK